MTESKKKKILFVITKSNFGGAQRYVYDLARSLPEKQFEVVVAFGGEGVLKKKLEQAGIRTVPLEHLERDMNLRNEVRLFFALRNLYRKERPDVVHVNSSKIGGMGALVGRLERVPKIVFTAHGWAFNEDRPWIQKPIIKFFHWLTVMLAHTTIAVSKQIKRDMGTLPFMSRKMVVIYNGIDSAGVFSKQEARELLRKANKEVAAIPEHAHWIGTVAELHKTKGHRYAIEAMERLVAKGLDVYFIIISDGEERNQLRILIEKKGLQGRIILFGFLDVAPHYLRAFDVFVLASISEALSLSVLEAGLSERAVVASRVGGIPEIIDSKDAGILVPPRDPEAIADGIERVLEEPTLATHLGENLRKRIEHTFMLDTMVKRTTEVYN